MSRITLMTNRGLSSIWWYFWHRCWSSSLDLTTRLAQWPRNWLSGLLLAGTIPARKKYLYDVQWTGCLWSRRNPRVKKRLFLKEIVFFVSVSNLSVKFTTRNCGWSSNWNGPCRSGKISHYICQPCDIDSQEEKEISQE